jgi:sugar phosphate isomerase/epimerase
MNPIAFNTANLVARVSGYRFELKHWGEQHQKTIAATDEAEWRAICSEIAAAGFSSIEIWEAHAAPESLDEAKAARWKAILQEFELTPVAYAGQLRPGGIQVCRWLGIPLIAGGLSVPVEEAERLCADSGIQYGFENHPEKSADEIRARIGGGSTNLGVAVDTGWLGTQGLDAPQVLAELGSLVRHVHIKDVAAAGGHETVVLGQGAVNVEGCVRFLKESGYNGALSWEDEPENRNPLEDAVRCRQLIEQWLA